MLLLLLKGGRRGGEEENEVGAHHLLAGAGVNLVNLGSSALTFSPRFASSRGPKLMTCGLLELLKQAPRKTGPERSPTSPHTRTGLGDNISSSKMERDKAVTSTIAFAASFIQHVSNPSRPIHQRVSVESDQVVANEKLIKDYFNPVAQRYDEEQFRSRYDNTTDQGRSLSKPGGAPAPTAFSVRSSGPNILNPHSNSQLNRLLLAAATYCLAAAAQAFIRFVSKPSSDRNSLFLSAAAPRLHQILSASAVLLPLSLTAAAAAYLLPPLTFCRR
ncbi:hypothetical protein QVD17_15844 [Tagetes erecta]|uniref:Uncharacterized protein n=1 Tax=Tagetes erecta TaxID=13708 RepID=A0AAD8KU14_TARER|nr:hypothetical protein QVD17_15844 [Tagetes erecta]